MSKIQINDLNHNIEELRDLSVQELGIKGGCIVIIIIEE